ncbi:pfh1 [Symbiodinium natans]|uniref:Pfh1 protein n=1 Tax=Symbiodinium natans TaxID=878477 RepID=A0A812LC58_9DINO|nr:pfh1 [Symbiodinium natans]
MHPRRLLEDAIRHLASEELRDDPLIPPGKCRQDIDKGEAWPRVFCAFKGCNWTTSSGSEEDLHRHVEETHYEKLKPAMEHMPKPKPKDITRSIYNEAVATVCRRQAPPAGCSRDRSALTSFTHAMTKDRIEALICFSCACIHTRVEEINEANSIDWYPILEPLDSKEKTEARTRNLYKILSLQKYLDTYDTLVGDIKLSSLTDFQDWQVDIPGHGAALCCPEDHRCTAHPEHPNLRTLCEKCEVPLCKDCVQHLRKGRLPPLSLCNDMWTGFAPERLYKENVTVMEMICASPCVTTLICFSMEARYGEEEKGTTAALDAKAHSALHRLGARGNALTFPMPWEELLANLKDALNAEEGPPQLPRAGQQLGEIVRVLLKTNKTRKTTASELKTLIHQATVRREVVIQLILDMKKSGHPAFQKIQAETVRRAASNLPEEGIPPEVLKVIETMQDSDDWGKLQPQKAATPVDHPHEDMHKAGEIFASQRAQGILAEGRSEERENQNAVAVAALNNLREQLTTQPRKKTDTLEVRTGNQLIDQFQPMYFATAFCFCFSHATACPDVQDTRTRKAEDDRDEKSVTNRRSRDPNAPSVQVHAWAAAMLRRAETQFRRDWTFGFTTWNFLFRTMVNLQKNTFMYATVNEQGDCRKFSNLEILHGIHEIQDALHHGKYMDLSNQIKPVKGDLSKVKYSIGLSEAAKKVLDNCTARCRNIPGTHDVRSIMRQETHANRICYGTPLFVTFSPSERDSVLMVRLARARESDPAIANEATKAFQSRDKPDLNVEYYSLDPEKLLAQLPAYDERRAMLAKDPLACADSFRVLVQLAMRHLFGVRFCPNCPECAMSGNPCTDAFGSNAMACGGIFGRVDSVYGSIECQKSGSLHIHFQVFVQSFHQFRPIAELQKLSSEEQLDMLKQYQSYVAHVSRTVYSDPDEWQRVRHETEAAWPAFRSSTLALSRPDYQSDSELSAETWKQLYLNEDVEKLQQLKQHHVHLPNTPDGPRMPLRHCRDPKDSTKCKAGFPRDKRLTEKSVLICKGLAENMGMPTKGKRSALGLLWGPCNDADLNGTHPAMLAALRCNSDVQVPYRFPITQQFHDPACCNENCANGHDIWEIMRQAQINQSAQAGYACDYQCKRLPIAINEVHEWNKSQAAQEHDLTKELQHNPNTGYVGARAAKRLATDCYARGVVRGAVECANLIEHAGHLDPTKAEAVKTSPCQQINLHHGLQLLEETATANHARQEQALLCTDTRSSSARKAIPKPAFWTIYAHRGRRPEVNPLSAYEFLRYYGVKVATRPHNLECQPRDTARPTEYHTYLTEAGSKRYEAGAFWQELQPGVDYRIREQGDDDWMPMSPMTDDPTLEPFRHDWIIVPRPRPHVPVVFKATYGRSDEEHAKRLLVLFRPWSGTERDATEEAPYIGALKGPDTTTWREALMTWATRTGWATEEVKRYVLNYAFTFCLPRQLQINDLLGNNSDNEDLEDITYHFEDDDLQQAKTTRVRGAEEENDDAEAPAPEQLQNATAATVAVQRCQLTKNMFHLSQKIWLSHAQENNPLSKMATTQRSLLQSSPGVADPDKLIQAAKDSRRLQTQSGQQQQTGLHHPYQRPAVTHQNRVTAEKLHTWLHSKKVQSTLNDQQKKFMQLIVDRILVEYNLAPSDATRLQSDEPLVWLLHGGPGSGKTHVLKCMRKLFQEVLGYVQGIDFEIAAFQATNAADIRGKTLHASCGLSMGRHSLDKGITPDTAKRIALWRWLIIDEIGMVSATLLAQVEARTRSATPAASRWKHDATGRVRPFAGLNVVFLGDFNQLPPPEGGSLVDVPACLKPADSQVQVAADPLIQTSREFVWCGALQGVTELVQKERCKDEWWNEVVAEMRSGHLSESNWKYLHGQPVEGCTLSAAERKSRKRVIDSPQDPRLSEDRFLKGTVIVANNDAKCQINKDRATSFAQAANVPIRWSVARDKAGTEVLQTQACDKSAKIRWLRYHDMDTEGLLGMLPLAVGLPVHLTQHVDRSDKCLLKGRLGYVHSWEWLENEQQPRVVYVKFYDADWTLDGSREPGLYPITPWTRTWKLDKGRKCPVLGVKRTQLPLSPAFAITAHSSQGKTLSAVLLDLSIDRLTHTSYGTVAASRVCSREDLLILRPFPLWLFQRGAPDGPELLLKKLRGELTLRDIREARWPTAPCQKCKERKTLEAFADAQWKQVQSRKPATCLNCQSFQPSGKRKKTTFRRIRGKKQKYTCRDCGVHKTEDAFHRPQLHEQLSDDERRCMRCIEASTAPLTCACCARTIDLDQFADYMRSFPTQAISCRECQTKFEQDRRSTDGIFKCRSCRGFFLNAALSNVTEKRFNYKQCINCTDGRADRQHGKQTCRRCGAKWEDEQTPSSHARSDRVCPQCREGACPKRQKHQE